MSIGDADKGRGGQWRRNQRDHPAGIRQFQEDSPADLVDRALRQEVGGQAADAAAARRGAVLVQILFFRQGLRGELVVFCCCGRLATCKSIWCGWIGLTFVSVSEDSVVAMHGPFLHVVTIPPAPPLLSLSLPARRVFRSFSGVVCVRYLRLSQKGCTTALWLRTP